MKQVAMLMLMLFFAVSCSKKEDSLIVANVSGNIGGHDYVDLGLPSGTLWATCNVGTDPVDGFTVVDRVCYYRSQRSSDSGSIRMCS